MTKRHLPIIILIYALIIIFSGCSSTTIQDATKQESPCGNKMFFLGKPFDKHYSHKSAKNPWDMIIFDGKLFVGSGDYVQNTGQCSIACFDPITREWSFSTITDEEINQFVIIDNRLTAPGIDPTDSWAFGNYYIYNDSTWETVRAIPQGIHCFSMISYKNMIFAGLGTAEGNDPVAVSQDGGKSFSSVSFYKNGHKCIVEHSANDRIYDLFVLDNHLFAIQTANNFEIYQYNGQSFDYFDSWLYKAPFAETDFLRDLQKRGGFFSSANHQNAFYFSTGYLFKTADGKNIEHIPLESNQYAVDLYRDHNVLYTLGVCESDDNYYIASVYAIEDTSCRLLFSIHEKSFPISLAVNGSDFYLGFACTANNDDICGAIVTYTYKGDK